jgi:3'-phosphoadenosine 5'-phosphosulfate sulfotransferase (PAPS reductase)/FAD synthetase
MSTTSRPWRPAATAAPKPAVPPPTTSTSQRSSALAPPREIMMGTPAFASAHPNMPEIVSQDVDGMLILVDDDRMKLHPGEVPEMKSVRFRTLGCYPLTGAMESEAQTLPAVIQEMLLARTSERQGRVIDRDSAASMEKKKQEGYF